MRKVILKYFVFGEGLLQWSISVLVARIQNEILQQLLQHVQRSFIRLWTCVFSSILE